MSIITLDGDERIVSSAVAIWRDDRLTTVVDEDIRQWRRCVLGEHCTLRMAVTGILPPADSAFLGRLLGPWLSLPLTEGDRL